MATIGDVIDSARYDLRDYQDGLAFDDEELLLFVNRMVRNLDSTLAAVNSDLVFDTANLTLATAANSISLAATPNSGNWDSVRALWIGQDKIEQLPIQQLFYERLLQSGTGKPYYWCNQARTVQFDRTADADYTVVCWYNKTTGTVLASTTTPYSGIFDDWLREMLVLHSKSKKAQVSSGTQGDAMYHELARKRVMEIVIRRNFVPKPYKIDF